MCLNETRSSWKMNKKDHLGETRDFQTSGKCTLLKESLTRVLEFFKHVKFPKF